MNIAFDIVKEKVLSSSARRSDVNQVREFIPEDSVPYVGEALKRSRNEGVEVTAAKGFNAGGMLDGLRASEDKPDLGIVTCHVDAVAAGQNIRKLVMDGFIIRKPTKIHSSEEILRVKED
ncbi:hypothetical protein Bca4012_010245 [Brassica carinata]|uniref:Uncharacterized protein n=1 Tax=Brassica carinata TaxID=52824 RepID=A0A8X7S4V1_BRACI|nr:hypothetical protein Bca52824_035222 [Brassica carinata]